MTLIPLSSYAFDPGDKTPRQHYESGTRFEGAFDVNDPVHCSWLVDSLAVQSPDDQTRLFMEPQTMILNRYSTEALKRPFTASALTASFLKPIDLMIRSLSLRGDSAVRGRHVCLGLVDYAPALNAVSSNEGVLAFDPQVLFAVNRDADRSMWGLYAVVFHEFGHQIQYWNANPWQNDATVRNRELAADCIAAALIAFQALTLDHTPDYIWQSTRGGIAAAIDDYGDSNFAARTHHGTSLERRLAANAGRDWAEAEINAGRGATFTGSAALAACNHIIAENNARLGLPWSLGRIQ